MRVTGAQAARGCPGSLADVSDTFAGTATFPHRMLALAIDWVASTLVAVGLFGSAVVTNQGGAEGFWVFAVYLLQASFLTTLVGGSFGQVVARLRVMDVQGGPVTLLRSFARHGLVLLVVPPLVFRPDGRGLHDVLTGTACVTLARYRGEAVGR